MNSYNVITLFPNLIEEWKNTGIINQALKNNYRKAKIIRMTIYRT